MTYITLVTGLSDSGTSQFMQIGGILTSLMSVAKTCSDWHLRLTSEDLNFTTTMKALLFFAPHVLWRTTGMAFVVAFLKFHSLIPLAVYFIVCIVITCFLHRSHENDLENSFASFALALFTPYVVDPQTKFGQSLLKSTMLTSSLILLPCLIFIRILPTLPSKTVLCTFGLFHLNLGSQIPSCSPCFNITGVSTGETCIAVIDVQLDFVNTY